MSNQIETPANTPLDASASAMRAVGQIVCKIDLAQGARGNIWQAVEAVISQFNSDPVINLGSVDCPHISLEPFAPTPDWLTAHQFGRDEFIEARDMNVALDSETETSQVALFLVANNKNPVMLRYIGQKENADYILQSFGKLEDRLTCINDNGVTFSSLIHSNFSSRVSKDRVWYEIERDIHGFNTTLSAEPFMTLKDFKPSAEWLVGEDIRHAYLVQAKKLTIRIGSNVEHQHLVIYRPHRQQLKVRVSNRHMGFTKQEGPYLNFVPRIVNGDLRFVNDAKEDQSFSDYLADRYGRRLLHATLTGAIKPPKPVVR